MTIGYYLAVSSGVPKHDNLERSSIADLITHWNRVIQKRAFAINGAIELEAHRKLGYYEGMFDQMCKGK